jgi:hypothetical protein
MSLLCSHSAYYCSSGITDIQIRKLFKLSCLLSATFILRNGQQRAYVGTALQQINRHYGRKQAGLTILEEK